MTLNDLPRGQSAVVAAFAPHDDSPDPIDLRLRELGFAVGEAVRVIARGPFGGEPLAVAIGGTRFALRASEAARVQVRCEPGPARTR